MIAMPDAPPVPARHRCFDRIGSLDPAFRFGGDDVDRVLLHRKVHDRNHSRFTCEGNQELLQVTRLMVRRHRGK
jgi:hypothetical protein